MGLINGNWYLDDFDRVEHMVDIVVSMHESYGISLEEAAGRFDRYSRYTMRFVKSEMFTHATPEQLAQQIYFGIRGRQLTDWLLLQPVPYP